MNTPFVVDAQQKKKNDFERTICNKVRGPKNVGNILNKRIKNAGNTSQMMNLVVFIDSKIVLDCSMQKRLEKRPNISEMERVSKEAKLVILEHFAKELIRQNGRFWA